MSQETSAILIAGSWHQGRCYERVTKILVQQYGLKCHPVTLPSTMGNPDADFKGDINAVRKIITTETSQGRDVVVIAHSFGGMVGNSAIKGLTRNTNEQKKSDHGNVIGLILIASGFTLTGLSFMAPLFNQPPPAWRVNKITGFADIVVSPQQLFYHDMPVEDADYWVSQLGHQSLKALFEGGEHSYAGWQDVPSWYIGTIEDQGLPVVAQRLNVGMARAMGANVEHRELQSSHSPFLSMPEETTSIIVDAISAFTGQPLVRLSQQQTVETRKVRGVVIPAPRLFAPYTWLQYGLPLAVGNVIGKSIGLYTWFKRPFLRAR